MVPHDWIWLASTQPVQSCPLPPLCLLRQFVAGLRVASVRSSEGSPATIFNFHRPPGSILPSFHSPGTAERQAAFLYLQPAWCGIFLARTAIALIATRAYSTSAAT